MLGRRSRPIGRRIGALIAVGLVAIGLPLGVVAEQLDAPEERMSRLINQARTAQGLPAVAVSHELTAAAEAHARDMAEHGYMEHENRAGLSPQQRAAKEGYLAPAGTAWLVLEVITARATPEAGLNWLLSDKLHRGVVLRKYWREIGVGYAKGGSWGQIWSIKFGCRPNVLPIVAEPNDSGGVTVRLTNEECAPAGGAGQIGRATEVMVSDRSDFDGASWEPFVTTKVVRNGSNVFVKYRDDQGRQTVSSTGGSSGTASLSALTTAESTTVSVPGLTPDAGESEAAPARTTEAADHAGQAPVISPTGNSNFVVEPTAPRP